MKVGVILIQFVTAHFIYSFVTAHFIYSFVTSCCVYWNKIGSGCILDSFQF